jgi:arabinose-5-phosphate isomerase
LFTDSDLVRLLESRLDHQLDRPIELVMSRNPLTVSQEAMLADVVEILAGRKISELPVVDERQQPVGMVDITDVIGLLPSSAAERWISGEAG